MKLSELHTARPLLTEVQLDVFNAVLPYLLLSEAGSSEATPAPAVSGSHWFNALYTSLKNLAVSGRISKRLKELNIKGPGAARVKLASKNAAKSVRQLLTTPGATAYRFPAWTTAAPPRPVIKLWNEEFSKALARELSKITDFN